MTNILPFDRIGYRSSRRARLSVRAAGERLRATLPREEILRTLETVAAGPALVGWRGRSGRRYVASVALPELGEIEHLGAAVVLGVSRGGGRQARVVDVAAFGPESSRRDRETWLQTTRNRGATELHVHRLAGASGEIDRIVADLAPSASRQGAPESAAATSARIRSLTPISTSWACVERT